MKHLSVDWSFKQLPENVISVVDEFLGDSGKMYFAGHVYPTGCYFWPYPNPIQRDLFPELKNEILVRLRKKLSEERVTVYIGEDLTEQIEPPCIVVAPTTDQFDILRIEGTCEPKRDIETIDILNFLLVIDQQFGIDIMGATARMIVFKLKRIPQGIEREKFVQWFIDNTPFDYPWSVGWPVDIEDADLLEPIEFYWED